MKTLLNINLIKVNSLCSLSTITLRQDSTQISNPDHYADNKPFGYEARENVTRGFPILS